MAARQVARQFCRLGEVHSYAYGRRASGKNGRKLTVGTRVGLKSRLMDYLGLRYPVHRDTNFAQPIDVQNSLHRTILYQVRP